jgi:hypothetical protein
MSSTKLSNTTMTDNHQLLKMPVSEEDLYRATAALLLSAEQQLNQKYFNTIVSQLRILNARKEELYNKDDLKEFQNMSPIKLQVKGGLDKANGLHSTNMLALNECKGNTSQIVQEDANESAISTGLHQAEVMLRHTVPSTSAMSLN